MAEIEKASAELQDLVAKSDTGVRKPRGLTGAVLFAGLLAWALFQLWYASPLPFVLGIGIFNDTEARAIHLAFALFLAFLAWPMLSRSPRDRASPSSCTSSATSARPSRSSAMRCATSWRASRPRRAR